MLNFKKRTWIVKQKERGNLTDKEIASAQKITRRHVQRIWVKYKSDGLCVLKDKQMGRRVDQIPNIIQEKILNLRKHNNGIRRITGLLNKQGLKISKEKVTRVLKENKLHIKEPKKGRRYKYIKWERKHSNSLWQTDFCWDTKQDCWITAWLDDHSRLITAAEYVTEATTDIAIEIFEKGVKLYGLPKQTLSDRGTQYYNAKGKTCKFLEHMKSRRVDHIYASVKKPTTCGKLERWWRTHNDERWEFSSLRKFVKNYNEKRPHMSLDYSTPLQVWKRDLKV